MFHAGDGRTDRQTDRHDESNSSFSLFSGSAQKVPLSIVTMLNKRKIIFITLG
jgi:hypothetical protein